MSSRDVAVIADRGSDRDHGALFRELRRGGDVSVRDQIVRDFMSLAEACARRFARRGEPLDDLIQVAMFGLVKAVDRYDPERGVPFPGFAVPTIVGELRRHFRDATWAVHVPRRTKELHLRLPAVVEQLRASGSQAPTVEELADELDVEPDEIVAALEAGAAYRPAPIDAPNSAAALAVGDESHEAGTSNGLDRMVVRELLAGLPARERTIVWLRFFEDLSQSEIAERVGMSQVHVSRLLRRTMRELRATAEYQPVTFGNVASDGN